MIFSIYLFVFLQLSISVVDRRKNQLQFRVNLIEMNKKPLLADFRLCKVSSHVFIVFIKYGFPRDSACMIPGESTFEKNNRNVPARTNFYDPVLQWMCENKVPVLDNTSFFCQLFFIFSRQI